MSSSLSRGLVGLDKSKRERSYDAVLLHYHATIEDQGERDRAKPPVVRERRVLQS